MEFSLLSERDLVSKSYIVSLMGGLGNQLFQYSAGLELANRNGVDLALDLSWFSRRFRRSSGLTLREFELSGVAKDCQLVGLDQRFGLEVGSHIKDYLLMRVSQGLALRFGNTFVEKSMDFDARVLSLEPGIRLIGYFQSRNYFQNVETILRERIDGATLVTPVMSELLGRSLELRPIILHIRRGDFLTTSTTSNRISKQYYAESVQLLRRKGFDGPVWLMSDDPGSALEWLSGSLQVDFTMPIFEGLDSLQSLAILSSGFALVISMSTFSWWGAFMSEAHGAQVVAPRGAGRPDNFSGNQESGSVQWIFVDPQ